MIHRCPKVWTTYCCWHRLFSFRHHIQLGSHLHPSHQQRLEPYPVHLDHKLIQRAGRRFTLSLGEKEHGEKRPCPQSSWSSLLPVTSLPSAGIAEWGRSLLCLKGERTFLAFCKTCVSVCNGFNFNMLTNSNILNISGCSYTKWCVPGLSQIHF